ncbi:MAG: hypothetical protein KDH88_18135 [Chromatiales bacterium]|nr:hypothetical protein [Chromatiales bacterium]
MADEYLDLWLEVLESRMAAFLGHPNDRTQAALDLAILQYRQAVEEREIDLPQNAVA